VDSYPALINNKSTTTLAPDEAEGHPGTGPHRPIPGHSELAWSSVDQSAIAEPIVNMSLKEKSEYNVPTDSQHANRTSSIHDFAEPSGKGKEKAIHQDEAEEDAAHNALDGIPTPIRGLIDEGLLKSMRELLNEYAQAGDTLHSSPQYGNWSSARP